MGYEENENLNFLTRLSFSINMGCFEALRRADIYAVGLLFWEICRRTKGETKGYFDEYKGMFESKF